MNTIRDAVDAFLHFYEDRTGRPSDDLAYPRRLIYYYLSIYRHAIVYEDNKRKAVGFYDEGIIQTLPCVQLRKADHTDDVPFAPPSGCYFLKTIHPLPKMMEGIPLAVTTIAPDCHNCDKEIREFDYVRWYNFQYKANSRVAGQSEMLYYTTKNIDNQTHLYVYVSSSRFHDLQGVAVTGVFKSQIDVLNYPICGEDVKVVCNVLDQEFIIEPEIQVPVFEATLRALTAARSGIPGFDVLNNDNPDNVAPTNVQ